MKIHSEEKTQLKMHNIKDPERMKDHHMFQVLQLVLKISANCTTFLKNEEYKEAIHLFAGSIIIYLLPNIFYNSI